VNPLIRKQFELNQATSGERESFAGHRRRVTELLLDTPQLSGRLCILGAGNCNDVHLLELAAAFQEIVLVDLDGEALARGAASESASVAGRLFTVEADISGALPQISTWSPSSRLAPEDLAALATGAKIEDGSFAGRSFDVVASTCLLSQLIGSLVQALTDRHPQFLDAVKAIRLGHFRTIASLLRPGGRAVFVSDVVSSDTCPELLAMSDANVRGLVTAAINAGNFFTGLNPAVILGLMKSDAVIGPLFRDVADIPPWVWHCGPRAYAVQAITATRAG
jgi:SAM-dependent methyltransferase